MNPIIWPGKTITDFTLHKCHSHHAKCYPGGQNAKKDGQRLLVTNGCRGTFDICLKGCLTDWTYNKDTKHWYKMFTDLANYTDAEKKCETVGGALTTVTSKREAEFLQEISCAEVAWIGLSAASKEDPTFTWIDGTPLNFTFWKRGEPNHYGKCVTMSGEKGDWNDFPCTHPLNYICKKQIPDWTYNSDTQLWYKEFVIKEKMSDAIFKCESLGGAVAMPKNKTEMSFLQSFRSSQEVMWIGLTDPKKDRVFKWLDGTSPQFLFWREGEPNFWHQYEFCATMSGPSGKWNDVHCTGSYSYICSRPNSKVLWNETRSTQ